VEDDPLTRNALTYLLKCVGDAPTAVASVAAGIAELPRHQFAIIDLMLPDGLGTEILHQIQIHGHPIQVAVTTATTDSDLLAAVERYRPKLILPKPIDVRRLLAWMSDAEANSNRA
jgi:DNA-binding NarL/FixJ family response regulator